MPKRKNKTKPRLSASSSEDKFESAAKGLGLTNLPAIGREHLALRGAVFAQMQGDKSYEEIVAEWAGIDKEQVGRVMAAIHAVVRGSGIDYAKFAVLAIEAWESKGVVEKMKEVSSD